MPHSVILSAPGGVENLHWQETPLMSPKAGEVLLKHEAIGLNFIDIYHRCGFYPLPTYPIIIGLEAAGIVEAVGDGVSHLKAGDRVAYGAGPIGAYAEYRIINASKLVPIPNNVSCETVSAVLLKGLTAHYLLHRTYKIKPGDQILVHAAAGGVGLLLCQWAKMLGAHVIGTVGSEEKAEKAKAAGCDDIIFYRTQDIAAQVKILTQGRGVKVAYDSVGKDTYQASLASLAPLGMLVSFGQSSGPMPLIDSQELSRRGSLFFTRPSLMHYVEDASYYQDASSELFQLISDGRLHVHIGQRFALKEAAAAHIALESGKTTGATVLIP